MSSAPVGVAAAEPKFVKIVDGEKGMLEVVLETDPLWRKDTGPGSDGQAEGRGLGTREYGSDRGSLISFGLPRFLCYSSAWC